MIHSTTRSFLQALIGGRIENLPWTTKGRVLIEPPGFYQCFQDWCVQNGDLATDTISKHIFFKNLMRLAGIREGTDRESCWLIRRHGKQRQYSMTYDQIERALARNNNESECVNKNNKRVGRPQGSKHKKSQIPKKPKLEPAAFGAGKPSTKPNISSHVRHLLWQYTQNADGIPVGACEICGIVIYRDNSVIMHITPKSKNGTFPQSLFWMS